MTIGNFTECLINDSNASLSIAAAASYAITTSSSSSSSSSNNENIVSANYDAKCTESSNNNDQNNKTVNITQNLGYIKKMRLNSVKTGRNHASAKYLAGLYSESIYNY